MELKWDNIESARLNLVSILKKLGYECKSFEYLNHKRYMLLTGENNFPNLFVMFKRDLFHNFGRMFEKEGEKGVGDTINALDLQMCLKKKVKYILTIFPNGKIYYIKLIDFLNKSHYWYQKEGKKVYSTSIHNFKILDQQTQTEIIVR